MLMPESYHSEHDGYLQNYNDTGDKQIIGIGRKVEAQRKSGAIFSMEIGVNEMVISGEKMFVGTIRDISDRKQTQQELQDNQAMLQAIVDNTVVGLIIIDEKGHIEIFNKACEHIFAYKAKEVIGENVKMLMPEPYHGEHDDYLRNYHDTGEKKVIGTGRQVEGRKKCGQVFPLDLSVSEVNVKGRTVFSGVVRDITELQEAQKRLAAVLDNTVDGLITIGETGTILHYNKACEDIFGYVAEEVIGQNVKMLMPEPYHSEHDIYLKNYHAVKYQDLSKDNSFIKIKTYEDDRDFVLEVRDNGLGVPKKQQDKLFQMFKRFHPRIAFGSGLGLYMMKKSADVLDGRICFSDPGDGAIFRLQVPLV